MTIIEVVAAILFIGIGAINGSGNYSGSNKGLYLSLNGGQAKSDDSAAVSKIAHGGAIGYFLTPNVDIGIEAVTTRREVTVLNANWTYSDTPILIKLDLHSTHILPGIHAGLRIGTSARKLFTQNLNDDPYLAQSLTYGAAAGYEYTFSSGIGIGFKALYLHMNKTEKTFQSGGADVPITFSKANYLVGLAELRYYF